MDHDSIGSPLARIGILLCDHVPLDLQEQSGGDYDLVYRQMMQKAEPRLEVVSYAVVNGEFPDSLDECDGWIITGSHLDADSDEPWVVALREWVGVASAAGARIAGVCFGHQLVAEALGGSIGRTKRWRVGPQDTTVDSTPWFPGGEVKLNAMHQDVVTTLPPGGRNIAVGTTSEFPAYLVGDNIVCVQDHPEFDASYVRSLIDARLDRIDPDTVAAARLRLDTTDTDGSVVGGWLVDFLLDRRVCR